MRAGETRNNCFDALRLAAAFLVIFDHSYLRGGPHHHAFADFGYHDIGGVAVSVFFAISGYLVTQSWLADPSLPRFFAKRCLRLFPALAVVVLVSVFVVGAASTNLPLGDYFGQNQTWAYLKNISLFVRPQYLPGVFLHNPDTQIVNGPLWSLPYEFVCYGIVGLCGVSGVYRHRQGNLMLVLALFAAIIIYSIYNAAGLIKTVEVLDAAGHVEAFLVASLLATGDLKTIAPRFLLPCILAMAAVALYVTDMTYAFPAIIAVVTVMVGRRFSLSWGGDDYSYGFYLWGYVVEQLLAAHGPFYNEWVFTGLAICLSYFPAMLSWHLVEKRALAYKPRRPRELTDIA